MHDGDGLGDGGKFLEHKKLIGSGVDDDGYCWNMRMVSA